MTKAPITTAAALQAEYANWFVQLQALTSRKLDPWDWTGHWNKGLTPKEAIADDD